MKGAQFMSVRFYPVQNTAFTENVGENGYRVFVNGCEVRLDAARVSAMPYNRRWPGHQRTPDQTETAQFLSMSSDEPLAFEVIPPVPSESVVIRPENRGINPNISDDGVIRFTMVKPSYITVEPYGRHNALHLFVDVPEEENSKPDFNNSDVIYYGAGIHEAGQITLNSNQTLYLDEGAVVYACISAKDARNIRIIGRGILDNSHNVEKILYETSIEGNSSAVNNADRQHTIQLEYCTDVEIDGITIRDSLVYNVRPIGCRGLTIRNVKIIGCWRFNSDGIDMHNCEDVLIEHCFLRTFDDSVCVKGFDCYYSDDVEAAVREAMYRNGEAYDVFRRAVVRDCVIWNDWGKCLEIGAETRAEEISDITFENNDIIHVEGPVLDCCNVDYADVHNVIYRNIHVELDEDVPVPKIQTLDDAPYCSDVPDYVPPLISVDVLFHFEYSAGGTRRGINRNILFENIDVIGGGKPYARFVGYSETAMCHDITVRNITVDGVLLKEESDLNFQTGDFCKNIRYEITDER